MLIEERFSRILKTLEEQESVTVQALTKRLKISESTIRRDLTELHHQGMLIKVHGGAVATSRHYLTKDREIAERQELNQDEKKAIARYCASLVGSNDFIFIDAGTTTDLIVDYLPSVSLSIVTNGLNIAHKLALRGYRSYLTGGLVKSDTEALVGSETIESLKKYNFTKGFFGTNAVNHSFGFTTPDIDEAAVKRMAITKCETAYVVCDSSKFNQFSSITFAEFEDVAVITGRLRDSSYEKYNNITEAERQTE